MKTLLLLETVILLVGQACFAQSNQPIDAHWVNFLVGLFKDNDIVRTFHGMLADNRGDVTHIVDFLNNIKCDATETLPEKLDLHPTADAMGPTREYEYSEFGYRLFLPWGPPEEYRTATNKYHNVTLGMSYSNGVIVNLFDMTSQGEVHEILSNDVVLTMFRLASADGLLVSHRRLWEEAMHSSVGQLTRTNALQQSELVRKAALLVFKRAMWPFKTKTFYSFNVMTTGVSGFQIGSPANDAMVYLELFDQSGRHATVVIRPQEKNQKTLPLTWPNHDPD